MYAILDIYYGIGLSVGFNILPTDLPHLPSFDKLSLVRDIINININHFQMKMINLLFIIQNYLEITYSDKYEHKKCS